MTWACDWVPDDLNPGPECPYCAGDMCARLDGLSTCRHDSRERHGYGNEPATPTAREALKFFEDWYGHKVEEDGEDNWARFRAIEDALDAGDRDRSLVMVYEPIVEGMRANADPAVMAALLSMVKR